MRKRSDIILSGVEYEEQTAAQIEKMMATPGWARLTEQIYFIREKLIDAGKKGRSEEAKQQYWAMLDGFDKATQIADVIVKKAKAKKDFAIENEENI